jgi:hypothetical protein
MGRFSKQKGRRGEYTLRDFLRKAGWQSERVYASGAIPGLPGDVTAEKAGRKVLFEMKCRANSFAKIYALLDASQGTLKDDLVTVCLPGEQCLCADVSYSLDAVFDSDGVYTPVQRHPLAAEHKNAFKQLGTVHKWVGPAEILVLKDDRRPLMFVRYR